MRVQGPRGLSLEECCLYLKTHISHVAKHKWTSHRLTVGNLFHFLLSNSCLLPQTPLFLHLHLFLLLIWPLYLSGFFWTLSPKLYPSFLLSRPPHVTPISVSPVCFLTARQSFFSQTRQHQNSIVTVENGCVFSERVCFSL